MTTTLERFWQKVDRDGPPPPAQPELGPCWLWTAALYGRGYGHFYAGGGRFTPSHRYSWELEHGVVPAGLYVLHHCDVRRCVRPSHLFLGTQRENIVDAIAKGRMIGPPPQRGEANPKAKITRADADAIRLLCAGGMRQADAGARFGVTQGVVSKIVRRELWATA